MMRALLFDLDDTLYAERQFVRSGFCVVAAEVEARFGVARREAQATLVGALRRGNRSRALQELCERHLLPVGIVPDLVDAIRAHTPSLRLPDSTVEVLRAARGAGWRLGVVTNGFPAIQARKIEALGLRDFVDTVVFAHECGAGLGKPERAGFDAALAALGMPADLAVFVGDDPRCDVLGARRAGMRTVWMRRGARSTGQVPGTAPDRVVTGMQDVLIAAEALLATEVAHAA